MEEINALNSLIYLSFQSAVLNIVASQLSMNMYGTVKVSKQINDTPNKISESCKIELPVTSKK